MVEWSLEALARGLRARGRGRAGGLRRSRPTACAAGESRSESVRNALAAAPEATIAVVHDAARPLVTRDLVERCLRGLEELRRRDRRRAGDRHGQGGGRDGRVLRTLDRSRLWAVQTPQVFRADVLRRALDVDAPRRWPPPPTTPRWWRRRAAAVRVVEASPENLKVTTPLDLRVAEAILRSRC